MSRVVVCGARGFVGQHLVQALTEHGHEVIGGSRSPERARDQFPRVCWVELDVERPKTLAKAFEGADAVVYLVHQMRSGSDDLVAAERESAHGVREAAEAAGVQRIVYLGGPVPEGAPCSKHLDARRQTGEALRGGQVSTIELRAGMIIGAGSESWTIVRDLALRLPVMILPRWLATRSQPIFIDDVVKALVRAVEMEHPGSQWYDLPGPEVLSARAILERVAAVAGLSPVMMWVPVLTPSLSSHWIRLITRADYTVAKKLVMGLTHDLVAPDDGFWALHPDLKRTPFDSAVAYALADEPLETMDEASRWIERLRRRFGGMTV